MKARCLSPEVRSEVLHKRRRPLPRRSYQNLLEDGGYEQTVQRQYIVYADVFYDSDLWRRDFHSARHCMLRRGYATMGAAALASKIMDEMIAGALATLRRGVGMAAKL